LGSGCAHRGQPQTDYPGLLAFIGGGTAQTTGGTLADLAVVAGEADDEQAPGAISSF
jgi:hypothetical protein